MLFESGHANDPVRKADMAKINSTRLEKVKLELSILGSNHRNWQIIEDLLESIKHDPELRSEESYKVLIKVYTHESVFRHIS